jgi:hypothetical protein
MNITGQPVQLGDGDRTTLPARFFKRGGKLRSPVEGIGPFAGLDLDVYATLLKAFGGGEALQCVLLSDIGYQDRLTRSKMIHIRYQGGDS